MLLANIKKSLSVPVARPVATLEDFIPYCFTHSCRAEGLLIRQKVSICALKLSCDERATYQNENATTKPRKSHMKTEIAFLCSFKRENVPCLGVIFFSSNFIV